MTPDDIYTAEDTALRGMTAAVLDYDGTGFDGIEAAYASFDKLIRSCPDNEYRTGALSALMLCKMRAKAHIDRISNDPDGKLGLQTTRVYPGDYLAIITVGLSDARMLAVASIYGAV